MQRLLQMVLYISIYTKDAASETTNDFAGRSRNSGLIQQNNYSNDDNVNFNATIKDLPNICIPEQDCPGTTETHSPFVKPEKKCCTCKTGYVRNSNDICDLCEENEEFDSDCAENENDADDICQENDESNTVDICQEIDEIDESDSCQEIDENETINIGDICQDSDEYDESNTRDNCQENDKNDAVDICQENNEIDESDSCQEIDEDDEDDEDNDRDISKENDENDTPDVCQENDENYEDDTEGICQENDENDQDEMKNNSGDECQENDDDEGDICQENNENDADDISRENNENDENNTSDICQENDENDDLSDNCQDNEECAEYDTGDICNCICKPGYIRDTDHNCVPICGTNEKYVKNLPKHQATCEKPEENYEEYLEDEGCICLEDFVRDMITGKCIREIDCPRCRGAHEKYVYFPADAVEIQDGVETEVKLEGGCICDTMFYRNHYGDCVEYGTEV